MGDSLEASSTSAIAEGLLRSYASDPASHLVGRKFLPSWEKLVSVTERLLEVLYPGYFGTEMPNRTEISSFVATRVDYIRANLSVQIEAALTCTVESHRTSIPPPSVERALTKTDEFLAGLPKIRAILLTDVAAAKDGDPAAMSSDEIILAYPGLLAVTIYRLAHELHGLQIPLLPRMMTEWAHGRTGIDIHPGAKIGPRFFTDHGTGIVIGETSVIGANVRIYQGVTLGAISLPRDANGQVKRVEKRHPTVEDDVTIYANASILGGQTVVGRGAVIGGGVFLTQSVSPGARVAFRAPELKFAVRGEIEYEI